MSSPTAYDRLHRAVGEALDAANEDWVASSWRDVDGPEGRRRYDDRARRRLALEPLIAEATSAALAGGVTLAEA